MQIVNTGTGGVLLVWPEVSAIPPYLDLFSAGVHLARQRLATFTPGAMPLVNLLGAADISTAPERTVQLTGQTEDTNQGAGVSEDWSVPGEQTPFLRRGAIGDGRVSRFDLTRAVGLGDFIPDERTTYFFSLAIAQHRCGVGLAIEWLDERGREIGKDEVWREHGPMGGRNPADYAPLTVQSVCPPRAVAARLVLVQGPPTENPDGYVFYRAPSLTTSSPSDRTIVPASWDLEAGSVPAFAILPLGDVLEGHSGPFEIVGEKGSVTVAGVGELARVATGAAAVTTNGAYLDVAFECRGSPQSAMIYAVIDSVILGFFDVPVHEGKAQARVRMPDNLPDGQPHWIEIRGGKRGELLHAAAHTFDAFLTPVSVIQEHTSRIDQPGIVPLAAMRYQGLAKSLARLASNLSASQELVGQVSAAHDYVVTGPHPDQTRFARLALPKIEKPQFSIVIPVHNKFYFTYFCIASVIYTCAGLPYEVILVDDGSSDQTLDVANLVENVVVVRNDKAQGFVGACNAGAAAARGEKIVFLNNDIETLGPWLEELHAPFLMFDHVGLTGSKLIYPDGKLQEAGGIVWNNGQPWNYGRDGNSADPRFGYTRQVDYLSGAAIMISRDVWHAVGGFSAEFAPAYYEDTDLAFKVRRAGLKTVFAARSTLVHYEGVSNGTSTSGTGLKRFQEINRHKFESKWLSAYRQFGTEGFLPDLEKDRGFIGRALVLDYQSPRYDKDAGSFAIAQEIRVLQALGYKVTFVPANLAYLGVYTDALERSGVEHLHAPFYSSIYDVLERRGSEFNLVYIHRHTTAEGVVPLVRQFAPQARVLLNCADLHFLRELRAARMAGLEDAFEAALQTRRKEIEVMEQCDGVLTYSEIEKAVIESYLGLRANVRKLPWIVPAGSPLPLAQRAGIVFIGSYDHPPNRDAVDFFLKECWPAIRAIDKDVTFTIVGSGFNRFVPDEDDDRVIVLGWVEDASAVLGSARIMVSPLRSGAGIKGKVLDAFVNGTPSVLSAIASEGMALNAGIAASATSAEDWVREVTHLLVNDDAWHALSEAGLDYIEKDFSFQNALDVFAGILGSVELPFSRRGGTSEHLAPNRSLRDVHLMSFYSPMSESSAEGGPVSASRTL